MVGATLGLQSKVIFKDLMVCKSGDKQCCIGGWDVEEEGKVQYRAI